MADINHALLGVDNLAFLPNGWDYGRERAPLPSTCVRARTVLTTLYGLGLRVFDVAPGRNSSITVAAALSGNEIEILCYEAEIYNLCVSESGDDTVDLERISFSDLLDKLRGLDWLPTKLSTWSIPNVICLTWVDSQVRLSRTHPMGQASQYFVRYVPTKKVEVCAPIYDNTPDQIYAANHQFFGGSNPPSSLRSLELV